MSRWIAPLRAELARTQLGPRDLADYGVAAALIGAFWYWGRPGSYRALFAADLVPLLGDHPLLPYAWWAASTALLRLLIPSLLIVWVYRERLSDYGWRLRGALPVGWVYGVMYAFMLPVVLTISFWPSFQHTYPFSDVARQSPSIFVGYELLYGLQFLGLEAFFRGWLLFSLARRIGDHAILVMTLPYVMIHFGKPAPEAFAAIFAGIALGWLALRSKTFLHGFALHWSVAITMDVAAIWQKGGFLHS